MIEVNIEAAIDSVRVLVNEAERSLLPLGRSDDGGNDDWIHAHSIRTALSSAYTQLLMLADALELNRTYDHIRKSYDDAMGREDELSTFASDPDGDLHLLAANDAWRFIEGFEAIAGSKQSRVVSRDVVEVLRSTLYAITDQNCFATPPTSEDDVHHRIEAVLRCVFPHLDREPPIPKAVKNFRPDTGLPSIRTLVEYKFLQTNADVARVADEILADTRGYKSSEWDSFIFVIYETKRLKAEKEWNRLLKQCGTAVNTHVIVLNGESPVEKKTAKMARTKPKPYRRPFAAGDSLRARGDE